MYRPTEAASIEPCELSILPMRQTYRIHSTLYYLRRPRLCILHAKWREMALNGSVGRRLVHAVHFLDIHTLSLPVCSNMHALSRNVPLRFSLCFDIAATSMATFYRHQLPHSKHPSKKQCHRRKLENGFVFKARTRVCWCVLCGTANDIDNHRQYNKII